MSISRHDLLLPELGLEDRTVTASMWLVERGAEVNCGDRLLEVQADGVTVDVPAPVAGVLVEILVDEDEPLEVGQLLGVIEESAECGVRNGE